MAQLNLDTLLIRSGEGAAVLTAPQRERIVACCGDWMARLGYRPDGETDPLGAQAPSGAEQSRHSV